MISSSSSSFSKIERFLSSMLRLCHGHVSDVSQLKKNPFSNLQHSHIAPFAMSVS